ncbi:MAG: hypothetical protein K8R59_17265 [Thermoanaerobaculales bacterium]|nr:hypothetical protein [Thermoanaerobaculales bacterium]
MRYLALCLLFVIVFLPAVEAVVPATDLFLPSVGRGQGACPGDVCSLWRTDVWIFNADPASTVTVEMTFLRRNAANSDPEVETVEIGPGQTLELADIMATVFQLDGVFGALRFVAGEEIVVTSRIYDANVQTNTGTGTAGQFFPALPARLALSAGETTDLIGLARDSDGDWRTNFGFVETTGFPADVTVELLDGNGAVLSDTSYEIGSFGSRQMSIADVGGPPGENQRIRVQVSEGPGRLLTFASLIDSRTGDPSTVEMVTLQPNRMVGWYEGVVMTTDGLRIDGGIELAVSTDGLTEFAGVVGIPCDDAFFTVDFGTGPIPATALENDGSFVTVMVMPYTDGGVQVFTIEWTLSGVLEDDGVLSGTLQSVTSDSVGGWSVCEGTAVRGWRAAWVER